jgi:hypothetical protein
MRVCFHAMLLQVYCMGAILPAIAGRRGQGKLSPAVVTTSSM